MAKRCIEPLSNGQRCKNDAQPSRNYCWCHPAHKSGSHTVKKAVKKAAKKKAVKKATKR